MLTTKWIKQVQRTSTSCSEPHPKHLWSNLVVCSCSSYTSSTSSNSWTCWASCFLWYRLFLVLFRRLDQSSVVILRKWGDETTYSLNPCSNFSSLFRFLNTSLLFHSLSNPSSPPHFSNATFSTCSRKNNIILLYVDAWGFGRRRWGSRSTSLSSGSVRR